MKRNRKPNPYPDEQPADLTFWSGDGSCRGCDARMHASTQVSIGRTGSKRALGFMVSRGKTVMDFVLDKDQVAELAAYLKHVALGRLRLPLGRKQVGLSLAAEHTPKRLLFRKLEVAGHERFRVVECGTEHGIDGGK